MQKIGIEHFKIVLIEEHSCNNKDQLLRHERHILELHDKQVLLNKNRPNITNIERLQQMRNWRIDNKDYHTNQKRLWFINNKTHHNECCKKIYTIILTS